jgi:iron complex transport system ATP-binding protein
MADALIDCRDLVCGYHGHPVLKGVSFQIAAGEVVALLGPNGTGKSTLLHTLSKTLPPIGGEARLSGADVRKLSYREVAQRVGFVPQEEPTPYPFSVREVVAMGRLPISRGIFDRDEDRQATDAALAEADCVDLQDRPITELSGGEKQRALVARALAQGALTLLMDEPTSHLDIAHQLAVAAIVRRHAQRGGAVLAAVHDLNLAATMATRGILLANGGIALDAPMTDVLRSDLLEATYGARFERIAGSDGALRVIPSPLMG